MLEFLFSIVFGVTAILLALVGSGYIQKKTAPVRMSTAHDPEKFRRNLDEIRAHLKAAGTHQQAKNDALSPEELWTKLSE